MMQADELKELRKSAKLTQDGLAEAIGMSRATIVEMEAGRAPIERRTELAVRWVAQERAAATVGGILDRGFELGERAEDLIPVLYPTLVTMLEAHFDRRYSRLIG